MTAHPPPHPRRRRALRRLAFVGFALLGGLGMACGDQVVVEGDPPTAEPGPRGQGSPRCQPCDAFGISRVLNDGASFCPEEQVKFDALIACACQANTCGANSPGASGRGDNCSGFEENPDDGLKLLCEPNGARFLDGSSQCSDCLFAFCPEEAEACNVF